MKGLNAEGLTPVVFDGVAPVDRDARGVGIARLHRDPTTPTCAHRFCGVFLAGAFYFEYDRAS